MTDVSGPAIADDVTDQLPPGAVRDPGTGQAAYNHLRGVRFLEIRDRLAEIEEEGKKLREEQATIQETMFLEIERTGVPSFVVEHGGHSHTLFVRHEVRVSALDQPAVVKWFSENGLASKVHVHPKSLEALVKEYKARNAALPPGLDAAVSVFDQHFIRSRKKK